MKDFSDYPGFRHITDESGDIWMDWAYEDVVSGKRDAIDAQIAKGILRFLNRKGNDELRAQFVEACRLDCQSRNIVGMLEQTLKTLAFFRYVGEKMQFDQWVMDAEHRTLMLFRACNTIKNALKKNAFNIDALGGGE